MKIFVLLSLLFSANAFASQRFGQCEKAELNRGCYNTVDAWCDPWNVTDACVFQCHCETEPVKRYPSCTYRNQDGNEYSSSGLTKSEACRRAKSFCEGSARNICELIEKN